MPLARIYSDSQKYVPLFLPQRRRLMVCRTKRYVNGPMKRPEL